MQTIKDFFESRQISIYFCTVAAAALAALLIPGTQILEGSINPALAFMLFITFLQVPIRDLKKSLVEVRFLAALLIANFLLIPMLVLALYQFLPEDTLVRIGVLLVLLTPCIDYVVTFSHLGRADARLLLSATPILLLVQMMLLPVYLRFFVGAEAANLVQLGPFIHAFLWLIAVPLACAGLTQLWGARTRIGADVVSKLGVLPVPSTAIVLFIVIAAVLPQLGSTVDVALRVVPIYVAFAVAAPMIGWSVGGLFRLDISAARSIAFSSATRNSLVVLPLALAIPGAVPVLPTIIVTQTLVELICSLMYIHLIPKLTKA